MRRETTFCMVAWLAGGALALPALGQQVYAFATPSDDQWQYPFNSALGTRPVGSCFSSLGTGIPAFSAFNDRDGILVFAWDTSAQIAPGAGPGAYAVESVTVTLTSESGATWPIDLTVDEWYTHDVNNDTFVNADGAPRGEPGDIDGESDDADPGRPLELFGAGFGPVYSPGGWHEQSAYVGGRDNAPAPRDPFPFVWDAGGNVLHCEDNVAGLWNEPLGVFGFTPQPWAIGVPIGYTPGAQTTPFEVWFEVDLSLYDGRVRAYFAEQLDAGRVVVSVTGLIETTMGGTPGAFPSFFMKEGVGLEPGAQAPRLTVVLGAAQEGDVNGDGCVDVSDLGIVLGNFGASGAGREDGDVTGDGVVDVSDLGVVLGNFGGGC